MQQSAKDFYRLIFEFNMEFQELVPVLQQLINDNRCLEEQADLHYAISQAEKVFEDLRKHLGALENLSTKVLCIKWATQSAGDNIRTDYVTSTPQVTEMPKIPSARSTPDEYQRLMKDLGVPDEMVAADVVRPHWPGFKDYIHTLAEEGAPLPDGCDLTNSYPVYKIRQLRKKGVLEED